MGLSTHLYAVEITAVRTWVGSNDPSLLVQLQEKLKRTRKLKTKDLVLFIDIEGRIKVDGIPQTKTRLAKEIVRSKWAKQTLKLFFQTPKTKSRKNSFSIGQTEGQTRTSRFISRLYSKSSFACISYLTDESENEEISVEEAALELVVGVITRKDLAYQYGYALELLCDMKKTYLGLIQGDLESALDWKTKLSKRRSPLKLPASDDFPAIGYLTAVDVKDEAEEFAGRKIEADQEWLTDNRRSFLQLMKRAAKSNKAIIAFCY